MAECAYCKAETQLYISDVPVCVQCSDFRSGENRRASLLRDVADATKRTDAASEAFQRVLDEIPSNTPHPDGVQRIKDLAHELTEARDELMEAHRQLDNDINPARKIPKD